MSEALALPPDLIISLESEVKNEIMREVAKESAERITEYIKDKYDGGILATLIPEEPRARLIAYERSTEPVDFAMIMQTGWTDNVRRGIWPMPVSPLWLALLVIPFIAEAESKKYRELRKQYIEAPEKPKGRTQRRAGY